MKRLHRTGEGFTVQYAIVDCRRIGASPGARGRCPICDGDVVARCGEINAWHWAHAQGVDCDVWAEGESQWHRKWKKRFPRQWREFTIGRHRADIKSPQGIIELQASSISAQEIAERELFYGQLVWLVDAKDFRLHVRDRGDHVTFRWKHPRKTWWHAEKLLFFDLGDRLIRIHRIHASVPCGGSGKYVTYSDFVDAYSRPMPGDGICEHCRMPFRANHLAETGLQEYYTMDLDPGTTLCAECYERRCDEFTPDDPSLFDCWTPQRVCGVG